MILFWALFYYSAVISVLFFVFNSAYYFFWALGKQDIAILCTVSTWQIYWFCIFVSFFVFKKRRVKVTKVSSVHHMTFKLALTFIAILVAVWREECLIEVRLWCSKEHRSMFRFVGRSASGVWKLPVGESYSNKYFRCRVELAEASRVEGLRWRKLIEINFVFLSLMTVIAWLV